MPANQASSSRSFLCGLMGSGVSRSSSAIIHETEAAALGLRLVYRIIDFESLGLGSDALPEMVAAAERLGFNGLNITHPYKQQIRCNCSTKSRTRRAASGRSTRWCSPCGRRAGYNTDAAGFIANLRRLLPDAGLRRVVQVGAGGAGSATAYAMLANGCERIALYDIDDARCERLAGRLAAHFGAARVGASRSLAAAMEAADGADPDLAGRRDAGIPDRRSRRSCCGRPCGWPKSSTSPCRPSC